MKSALKRSLMAVAGLTAVGGTTAAIVACGSSGTTYAFRVYDSNLITSAFKANRTGTSLRLWVPYSTASGPNSTITSFVTGALSKAGYTVDVIEDSSKNVDYSKAASVWSNRVSSSDSASLPDVIINYPDLQAIIVTSELAQSFAPGSDANIASSLRYDTASVLGTAPGLYAMPFLKSSELTYFNIPAFLMVLNQTALQKTASDTLVVPADSAQARMLNIIKQTYDATTANPSLKDIYAAPAAGATVSYTWSSIQDYYKKLSAGAWKDDYDALNKNFTLQSPPKLLGIDWSRAIFSEYNSVLTFVRTLAQAYKFNGDANNVGILGIDSPTNVTYSYQFDAGGHSQSNFYMRANQASSPPKLSFDFSDATASGQPSSLFQGVQYVSDLVNTGATVVRDTRTTNPPYISNRLLNNQLFMAWDSTSGVPGRSAAPASSPDSLNLGQVFYDLQPTRAGVSGESSTKSIINQGPSIFVTKVHPDESAKIAAALSDAFKAGGAFTAVIDDKTQLDSGVLGKTGYTYADVTDNAVGSAYLKSLSALVADSANWTSSIGKYLVSSHYAAGTADATKANAYANPAGSVTSQIRTQLDAQFIIAGANRFAPAASGIVQAILQRVVPDGRLA